MVSWANFSAFNLFLFFYFGQLGALDFYCEPNVKIIGRNVRNISIGKLEGRNKNSCWEKENTAEDHYDLMYTIVVVTLGI